MRALDARSWAGLGASVALHALCALVFVLYGRTIVVAETLKPPVDVWAGNTVEIADLLAPPATAPASPAEALPREESDPAPPRPPPAVARSKAEPPAEQSAPRAAAEQSAPRAAVERPAPERAAAEDDLTARILAYQPKPRMRPAEPGPAEPESAEIPESAPRAGGTLGGSAEAGPPRNFARAFTRAIPAATTHDRAWTTLPVGSAGALDFVVEIDDEGHVAGRDVGKDPPKHLERVVDQTLLALRGGRFELTGATTGKQRLRIAVTLSEQPVEEGPLALGFRSPGPGSPGLAYFQLASGRRVDVVVTLLP